MTTNITDRFSKITRITGPLNNEDRVVISQQEGSTKKTANATVDEVYTFVESQILNEGVPSILTSSYGILGKGTVNEPMRLDPVWLNQMLVRKDRLSITRVGNRKTRYLPLARQSLYESSSKFNSKLMRAPYTSGIENTGELRIIQPAKTAYTLSIGDWRSVGTVESLQIIERRIRPVQMLEGYVLTGMLAKSKNSAVLVFSRPNEPTVEEIWYASLDVGSIAEESFFNLVKIADRNSVMGNIISNNSVACAHTALGGRMFFVTVPSTNPNAGIEIRVYTLGDPATANGVAEIAQWNVSSYVGLMAGQNCLRASDKFLGTGTEKCELLDKTNGSTTVELLNTGTSALRIQCVHNHDVDDDLYLIVRREHLLVQNGVKKVYVHDLPFKLSVNYRTGVGSAIAIPNYLNNKPTIDANWLYTNRRSTFRSANLAETDSEMMTILEDGSIMLVGDTANGNEQGLMRVKKSPMGWGFTKSVDIDWTVKQNQMGEDQIIDPKPGYGAVSNSSCIYISSPIRVYMNGAMTKIPAQVLDLSSERAAAPPTVFNDLPYAGGIYAGRTLQLVYLYLQQSGNTVQLVKTHQQIAESVTNSLLAIVFFSNENVPAMIYGQAYSRMNKYRPSYVPMGAAAPVSYNLPSEKPKQFWLQQAMSGDGTPTFWVDAGATNTQLVSATHGRTIYIRVIVNPQYTGRTFKMVYAGIDLGTQTFKGVPLIWQSSAINGTGNVIQQPAILIDAANSTEVARSYLTVTPYPFITDVVGSDGGDDVVTTLINLNTCYIRVRGYDLEVGDAIQVRVTNPFGGVIDLGVQTYPGYPLHYAYQTNGVGTYQVSTTNVTRNQSIPNVTFNTLPAITNYTPGMYDVSVPAGRTIEVTLVAAGGGGGGSIHNYSSSVYWVSSAGQNGGDTWIAVKEGQGRSSDPIVAEGGRGGKGGNWSNGSAFGNGDSGVGGGVHGNSADFPTVRFSAGLRPPIISRWELQPGGGSVAPEAPQNFNGAGGAGAWGCGDENWAYGGGGGSGAKIVSRFTNNSGRTLSLTLSVGAAGLGWKRTSVTNGNEGFDGAHGYGIVQFV